MGDIGEGPHLHKCVHFQGHCPLWPGNRLHSQSSMPRKTIKINTSRFFNKRFCKKWYPDTRLTDTRSIVTKPNVRQTVGQGFLIVLDISWELFKENKVKYFNICFKIV